MAAPTIFNTVTTNPGGTGSTLTVTLSTHAVNDVIYIHIFNTGNVLWTGNPAGWNRLDQRTVGTSSNGIVGTWFWRKVVSGDSLPLANPVFTLGATVTRSGICRTVRGADLESPFVTPNYGARGFATGTANPIRPPAVTTSHPEMLILHCYGQRSATNAPEPSGYAQDGEVIISGTLVCNASSKTVADQNTALSNQDASPTSGVRWAAGIVCVPSIDYPYYRSGSQATASATNVTPALPTGTTASDQRGNKDLIIATAEAAGTNPFPNTGADWTEITSWQNTTSGGATTVRKYWALYDGSLDLRFNRAVGSGEISVCLTTYYNAHQTAPIGNSDADPRASSTTSPFDAVNRSFTKVAMQATCVADAIPTFTSPSGWTERMDGLGITCSDQTFNAAGSTASASFTLSSGSPTLVGLVELKGLASQSGVTEFERSIVVDASAAIASLAQFFTVFERNVSISVTATVESSGQSFSVFERSAAASASASIESAGQFFSVIDRAVALNASVSIALTALHISERSAVVSASAIIESSGVGFTTFERAASVEAGASISSTGESYTLIERSAACDAVGSIATSGVRVVDRLASVTATGVVSAAGEFLSILERVVSVDGAGTIATSAEFFSILTRQIAADAAAGIAVAGQRDLLRSVGVSALADISSSGEVLPPGVTEHERGASVSATSNILTSGLFFSVFQSAVACDGIGAINVTGLRIVDRSGVINAVGEIQVSGTFFSILDRAASLQSTATVTVSGQTEQHRSALLSAAAGMDVSGNAFTILERTISLAASGEITVSGVIPEFTEWERSIAFEAIGTVSVSGGKWVPNVKRTVTVGLASREVTVPAPNRTLHVE